MALGYIKTDVKNSVQGVPKKYLYPFKSRIDKVVESADIEPVVHGIQRSHTLIIKRGDLPLWETNALTILYLF